MAFSTLEERRKVVETRGLRFIVRVKNGDREDDLIADDFDHAFNLKNSFSFVDGVEIHRVLFDGSLLPVNY